MKDNRRYFVVTEKAVPDVLLKVVEAKRLLDIQQYDTVQEAVEAVGISRSSFYKYKDDIFPFKEKTKGHNILTIHQSIPMNGIASLTLSVAISAVEGDAAAMMDNIEHINGVHYLKILGRE